MVVSNGSNRWKTCVSGRAGLSPSGLVKQPSKARKVRHITIYQLTALYYTLDISVVIGTTLRLMSQFEHLSTLYSKVL